MAMVSLISGLLPNVFWPVRVEKERRLIAKAGDASGIEADPYDVGVAMLKTLMWSAEMRKRVKEQLARKQARRAAPQHAGKRQRDVLKGKVVIPEDILEPLPEEELRRWGR